MERINTLTGIRGFAALWVVFFHVAVVLSQISMTNNHALHFLNFGFLMPFIHKGYLAVDLFFILSGFVITYIHQKDFILLKPTALIRFYLLRIARIFPVHYFTLLLMFVSIWFVFLIEKHNWGIGSDSFSTWGFICNVFNIQAWETLSKNTWNYAAWSVSAEWFAYLLFPFITLPLSRVQKPILNVCIMIGMVGVLLAISIYYQLPNLDWTYHLGLIRVMTEFVIGCSLFNLSKEMVGNTRFSGLLSQGLLMAIITSLYIAPSDIMTVVLFIPFLYFLSTAQGAFGKIFSNSLAIILGEISYSIYMIHPYINLVLRSLILHFMISYTTVGMGLLVIVFWVISIIGVGYGVFHLVEDPARKRMRKWIDYYFPTEKSDIVMQPTLKLGLVPDGF